MRHRVVVDMDGVLANATLGFSQVSHQLFGTPVQQHHEKQTWTWEFCSSEQIREVWRVIDRSPMFWLSLEPLIDKDDVKALWRLADRGAELVYITGRSEGHKNGVLAQCTRWLAMYDLPDALNVVLTRDPTKQKDLWDHGPFDAIIDDKPDVLSAAVGMVRRVYRRSWGYNSELEGTHGICSVSSVREFAEQELGHLQYNLGSRVVVR